MARRPSLTKASSKKTKIRSSRSEGYIINKKYLGNEPEEGCEFATGAEYTRALSWYNYQCTVDDAREYLTQYLIDTEREEEAKVIRGISDTWIPLTACWGARMITRGCEVPDSTMEFVEGKIDEMLLREQQTKLGTTKTEKASVHDKMRERQSQIIADIDDMLDTGAEFSLYEWLKINNVPMSYMPAIVEYYTPIVSEYVELLEYKDDQLMEAYCHMTMEEHENRALLLGSLVEDADRYADNAKAARAPIVRKARKKKAVSADKKLQHFKYQKEDIGMKIASVNPEKILGAKELWTYNTRYKFMTVMRANDGGLDVKGTTVINIDTSNSTAYRCGRKPEKIIQSVFDATKHSLKNIGKDLQEATFSGRINENTILLRIVT